MNKANKMSLAETKGIKKNKERRNKMKYMIGEKLQKALRTDKELYFAYQSNIAMAFYDEYRRNEKKYKNHQDIRLIANNAAKYFLDLLIKKNYFKEQR